MTPEQIAEQVMIQHGMTSLDEFGKRMTMGEMRRMLVEAARWGQGQPDDMFGDPAEPGRLFP